MSALASERRLRPDADGTANVRRLRSSIAAVGAADDVDVGPVSPELVLVDPELARLERARLTRAARLEELRRVPPLLPAPPPPVPLSEPEPAREPRPQAAAASAQGRTARSRVLSVVLTASLAANALFILAALGDARAPRPTFEQGPATMPARTAASAPTPSTTRTRSVAARPAAPGARSASAERTVLTAVVRAPRGKLPPRLIDRETGIAKNGLQAVCRQTATRTFACVVRPTRHERHEGLAVRLRIGPDGRPSFTWSRYRVR